MAEDFQNSSLEQRSLTQTELELLSKQDSRIVPEFRAQKFQNESKKHWDLFYKRNTTKFFKDRHWTTREFKELTSIDGQSSEAKTLLEVGCGVGNFAFPLLEEVPSLFIFLCDFSPRAVEFVKTNDNYDSTRMDAFQCDITETLPQRVKDVDIVTMIFVLSAITPTKFEQVFENLAQCLRPGGKILFRDYAINDHSQIRFKPGTKIADRLYLRQDGTTSYFFELDELKTMAQKVKLDVLEAKYVYRKTVNCKEDINVERTFLQAVLQKPL